jgi:hypothetical protein
LPPVKRRINEIDLMPLYFMLHDAERFETLIRPALAASRRQRSFAPCEALRSALAAAIEQFVSNNRIRPEELILLNLRPDMPFNQNTWRMLAGEVLLAAADEMPEVPDVEESLVHRLGDDPSIQQAYHGTHALCFGGGWYRPDHAGYNDLGDVRRLADFLSSVDPDAWTGDFRPGDGPICMDERYDDLIYTRQGLKTLTDLYSLAKTGRQLIVCEEID